MTKIVGRAFALWLPLLVAITGAIGFAFIGVQQSYRQLGNDPQIQLAEHDASALASDYTPASVIERGAAPVDIGTSLDTWVAVYDSSGIPFESSATLDGAPPRMPDGFLDINTWVVHKTRQAPSGPETRVSWQPRPAVRQAVVIVQFDIPTIDGVPQQIGYVAVGRSMRLTEERILDLAKQAAVAWSATALGTLFVIICLVGLGWF